MAARWPARFGLLLLSAVLLGASPAPPTEGLEPALLDADGCESGAASCDSQALSLRQLRVEPVRQALAVEQQSREDAGALPSEDLGVEAEAYAFAPTWGLHTWVVVADSSRSGWAWDVVRVKFITNTNEELSPSTPGCHLLESGHVETPGYSPLNAFRDDSTWWGGRKDQASQKFYLGITCAGQSRVAAVQLHQLAGHSVHEVKVFHNQWQVQAKQMWSDGLQSVWEGSFGLRLVAKSLRSGWAWDVRRLNVAVERDLSMGFDGGELKVDGAQPFHCHAVESGHADTPGYEVENAFSDSGNWWGGRAGPARNVYVGIVCDHPFPWPETRSVYLDQLGGHYASEVELQQLTAFGWNTKGTVSVGPGGHPLG